MEATAEAVARKHPAQDAVGMVFDRINNGLNVKVGDLAPLIGITEAGLYRAVRENRVEAVTIGRAVFIPARVAGPLLGIKAQAAA